MKPNGLSLYLGKVSNERQITKYFHLVMACNERASPIQSDWIKQWTAIPLTFVAALIQLTTACENLPSVATIFIKLC